MTHALGCRSFWLWGLAGALLTLSLLGAASIGIFVLPFALLALWLAARTRRVWPEALGGLAGIAGVCLFIAWIQRGGGGLDSISWLVAGAVLGVLGIGGYALATRRLPPPI